MAKQRRTRRYIKSTPQKPELEISSSQEIELDETIAPGSLEDVDSIPPKDRGTSSITTDYEEDEYKRPPVSIRYQKRESVFYSITESEIDAYAQLGWFSNIFLTLFGSFFGICSACILALKQGNLPNSSIIIFNTLGWITGIVSLIFFGFAIFFIIRQTKNKKEWEKID